MNGEVCTSTLKASLCITVYTHGGGGATVQAKVETQITEAGTTHTQTREFCPRRSPCVPRGTAQLQKPLVLELQL